MADSPIARLVDIGERERERSQADADAEYRRKVASGRWAVRPVRIRSAVSPIVAEALVARFGSVEACLTADAVEALKAAGGKWIAVARALEAGLPDGERARLRARVEADREAGAAMLAAQGALVDVGAWWKTATEGREDGERAGLREETSGPVADRDSQRDNQRRGGGPELRRRDVAGFAAGDIRDVEDAGRRGDGQGETVDAREGESAEGARKEREMSEIKSDENRTAMTRVEPTGAMALEPRNIGEGMQLAAVAAKTRLFGVTSADDAFVRMATGMALGLSAWQSLRGLFVISGKVGLAADLMLALCLSSPDCDYFRCIETTAERATFEAKRKGAPPQALTFTMADAKQAGLAGNPMYAKFPANMLRARAIAFLARLTFPERMHGILTREEIDSIEEERGREPTVVEMPTGHGDRAARPGPPPVSHDILRERARWAKDGGDETTERTLAASPDPKDRAMVFEWRIGESKDGDALAAVVKDVEADPHAEMRAHMLGLAERRRQELGSAAA